MQRLFLSGVWPSGRYPKKLAAAMRNSATVYSAWEDGKPIGLINALDDGGMTAYVHFLLVDEACQGQGIGKELTRMITYKYRDYHCVILMSETVQSIPLYERCGFQVMKTGTPMKISQFMA